MKRLKALSLGAACAALSFVSLAASPAVSSLEDYNRLLPFWGVSWSPGAQSTNGYYPSFYTGFVMRSEFPERIHVQTSRGNQTRVSVILDEQTVNDYIFDLAKRYSFYNKVTKGPNARLNIAPKNSSFLPQLSFFNQIVESQAYGILPFVDSANKNQVSSEQVYSKSLQTLAALNPGRVFNIRLDLKNEFNKWKAAMQQVTGGNAVKVTGNAAAVVSAINTLVLGRINYTDKPTADVLAKLDRAVKLAIANAADEEFVPAAMDLFAATTGSRYAILVLNQAGQWEKAVQCPSSASCTLNYPEFTAIYPTGSVMDFTTDENGNRITSFATTGLWQFLSRSGGREVDNIRNEPYYGFAPKMDFQDIGNGFHNPAVRFWDPSKALKQSLGIDAKHNTLWAAKRGGISHGCLRLPLGHLWEMRQIFPVENSKMTKILFFANQPQDFDVFDVNGDGQAEVMGVEYLISYGLQGVSDSARREGSGFEVNNSKKLEFYTSLYGAKNVFNVTADNKYIFVNPRISIPSHLDYKRNGVNARLKMNGHYPLYEQAYEREKVQLYGLAGDMGQNKDIVRLMGRVRGCAPSSDKQKCGEAAFDQEAGVVVR